MREFDLEISRESGEGVGIGFWQRKAVFVQGALAGENVRVRMLREQKSHAFADLLDVLCASPERAVAPCPYYGACGGCSMQHMGYTRALEQKRRRVCDCLARIGGLKNAPVTQIAGMEDPWRYRNKAVVPADGGEIGFYRANSRSIVPMADCLLQGRAFAPALEATRAWLGEGGEALSLLMCTARGGSALAALHAREKPPLAGRWAQRMREKLPQLAGALWGMGAGEEGKEGLYRPLWGAIFLEEEAMGVRARVSPGSFRQVNPAQADRLYEAALNLAQLNGSERVIDAYCGAGSLTQLLAARAKEAVGIEIVPDATAQARESAQMNGARNVRFLLGACEALLPGMRCDVLVLDPPRRGCDEKVIAAALEARPEKIVYISCDPATLARDVKALSGAYRLIQAVPVDMFPWTAHVETIVLLQR